MDDDGSDQQRSGGIAGEDESGDRAIEGNDFAFIRDGEHSVAGKERQEPHIPFGGEDGDEVLDDEPPDQQARDGSRALPGDQADAKAEDAGKGGETAGPTEQGREPAMVSVLAATTTANRWDLHDDWAPLRFAAIALVALVPFTFTAIAEEFGWRGYLTPRLAAAGVGRLANHVIVGVVWGIWHLPYMAVFWDFSDESLWTLAPRVVLGTTVAAIIYGEIRLRTGTVWPAVVMHAAGNAIAAGLLDSSVLVQNEATPWIFGPGIDGAAVLAITASVAALLLAKGQPD